MNRSPRDPWLVLQRIGFGYRHGERVLNDVSLQIRSHELILLSGRNGSGKTTLMRVIAGLQGADCGQVEIDGTTLPAKRAARQLLKHCCYLHQQPYLFDGSVRDNIAYGLKSQGSRGREIEFKVGQALERFELQSLASRHSKALSGGEKQRVALARAWVLSPRLMLLDEPLANMDQESRHATKQLIASLCEAGMGIVITSHENRHRALPIDRHLRMHNGRLQPQDTAKPRLVELSPANRLDEDGRLADVSEQHSGN